MNQLAADCFWDQHVSVELRDQLLAPDEHQIADRGGVTYDGHGE
jgi:hypothetical protein